MITINTRTELNELLYGENSTRPDTLVGVAKFGNRSELHLEATSNWTGQEFDIPHHIISGFFPMGDEGEWIEIDLEGNIVGDFLYY